MSEVADMVLMELEEKMEKAESSMRSDLNAIRTGKASPSLVEGLMVDYYGVQTRLRDMAQINAPEPRLLTIQPWDASAVSAVEKAIKASNLGIMPSLLITGPKNEEMAFSILKDRLQLRSHSAGSVSGVGTAENPWNNSAELLILPELSGEYEDNWYLAATDGVLKPVFVQQRKMPSLVRLDSEGDENVFRRKEYIYGTSARGASFLAFPHLIYQGGSKE